ncbi:MAG: L,D-transpeptidase, partial [Bradyrhizobium sp.]|nr:L,D-transpeptidase [Bradyrhizobium sp.]
MSRLGLALSLAGSLLLSGCMEATLSPTTDAALTPRDKQLLARA